MTPITSAGTYTSATIDMMAYLKFSIACLADQNGTLYAEQSSDGTSWTSASEVAIKASVETEIVVNVLKPYMRARYVNSANPQGYFKIFLTTIQE